MELSIESSRTALVVIDLQRGIVGFPAEPHPGTEVVANAAKLASAFRAAGGTVVLVHVTPSPDGKDGLRPIADAPAPSRGQMPPDWAEFAPEMTPQPGDVVITKRQWGAFYGTDLDLQLRRRHITTIVLGGISTNMGVESTARAAQEHGYHLVLVEDAMSARTAQDHAFAITRIFPKIGRLTSTSDVLAAFASA